MIWDKVWCVSVQLSDSLSLIVEVWRVSRVANDHKKSEYFVLARVYAKSQVAAK